MRMEQERIKAMSDERMAPEDQSLWQVFRQRLGSLPAQAIVNFVLPLVIYLLASQHTSMLTALVLTAAVPMLYSIFWLVRMRRVLFLSIVTLFVVGVSLLIALLVHDPRLLLLRDACLAGGLLGLICLFSLLHTRPIAYTFYRWAFIHTPVQSASLTALWQLPHARFSWRMLTTMWGLMFLGLGLIEAALAYRLPPAQFLAVHPFLLWGTIIVTVGITRLYGRQTRKQITTRLQQVDEERGKSEP